MGHTFWCAFNCLKFFKLNLGLAGGYKKSFPELCIASPAIHEGALASIPNCLMRQLSAKSLWALFGIYHPSSFAESLCDQGHFDIMFLRTSFNLMIICWAPLDIHILMHYFFLEFASILVFIVQAFFVVLECFWDLDI